ncbi:hypothetical protein [Myxosarcina sp. GI1(2024)]
MIRSATLDDRQGIMPIANAINLFTPPELEELDGMLVECLDDDSNSDLSLLDCLR